VTTWATREWTVDWRLEIADAWSKGIEGTSNVEMASVVDGERDRESVGGDGWTGKYLRDICGRVRSCGEA